LQINITVAVRWGLVSLLKLSSPYTDLRAGLSKLFSRQPTVNMIVSLQRQGIK